MKLHIRMSESRATYVRAENVAENPAPGLTLVSLHVNTENERSSSRLAALRIKSTMTQTN